MTAPPPDPTGLALLKQALDLPTQVLDLGCGLVRDLVGEPVKVAGGMLSDQVYAWQWGNRVRIAHRAAEVMEKDGIARRIVPPSFLLPLLDAAGNVEDPDLQEMWARLLASGVAADEHQHPILVNILRQLDSGDASAFRSACAEADERGILAADSKMRHLWGGDGITAAQARLEALGLIMFGAVDPRLPFVADEVLPTTPLVVPTRLGVQFRRSVMPTHAAAPDA